MAITAPISSDNTNNHTQSIMAHRKTRCTRSAAIRPRRFFHFVAGILFAMIMMANVWYSCGLIEIQTEKEKHARTVDVQAVEGNRISLPCPLTAPYNDKVYMVLWFRDDAGVPLYSFDVRGRAIPSAQHWSAPETFGSRARFNADGDPATLDIKNLKRHDQGVYRCRVDFRTSQTQSFRYNLTIIIAAVIFGVLVAWFILSLRYNSNILQTVIESPAYSIKKIPFPAVTLCNSNRLNMHRIEEVADKFIPNATAALRLKFKKVLSQLNILRFGWFHYMTFLKNYRLEELNKLNLSQVFIFTMYKCSELFVSCYWNGRETDCCKIFFVQSTDYGYCYGFNSLISLDAYEFNTHQKISSKHPLYTDYYGVGSGLRVIVNIKRSCNALVTKISGVNVITHRNYEWPTTGYFVPVGNSVTISLRPNLYRTTDALQHYSNTDRQCLFEKSNDMKKYFIPKEVPFLQANCKVECRRYYMNKFCNCTIDIFYPTSPFRACNITGVLCLNDYNDVLFKDILAVDESTYSLIDKGVYGMKCSCLPECIRIEYGATVQNNLIWETENSSVVNVNVFYTSPTMVKYRTEASLHRLQFITNFGGILAFFFGASLLSVIEMIHRLFVMFLRFIFHRIKTHAFSKQKPDDLTV